jgi:CrcB protein
VPSASASVRDDDADLPAQGPMLAPHLLAAVTVGGVLGALGRYGLGVALPTQPGFFPATTVLINLSGAFLLAALIATLARRPAPSPLWRLLLGTGVLGGYTTFSTFAVDADRLVSTGHGGLAAGYVAATLLGGALATAAGLMIAGGQRT